MSSLLNCFLRDFVIVNWDFHWGMGWGFGIGTRTEIGSGSGTGATFNITAYDAYYNVATGYNGTAVITSSDPAVATPAL